jgi:hypothetical protein
MQRVKIIKPERVPLKQKTVTIKPNVENSKVERNNRPPDNGVRPPNNGVKDRQDRFVKSLQPINQKSKNEKQEFRKYGKIEQTLKDKTVFLIAGGPSLKDFDFSSLKGKNVIAINKAFMYLPEYQYLYWTDSRFYTWYKNDIDKQECKKYTPCINPNDVSGNITVLKNSGGRIIDLTTPDSITAGNNSGFGAISLAIKLGASKIYLLGYDMGYTGNKTHFHDGYPSNTAKQSVYNSMLKYFEDNADIIKSVVKIYNTSATSNLKCFDYCDINIAISTS